MDQNISTVDIVPFPSWLVVKDLGLIPDPGRSPIPQGNYTRVPQLLSLGSGAQELQLLRPHAKITEAHKP